MPPRLAYLMSRFPHLPETFILREMVELERMGWSLSLYPILLQKQAIVHPEARAWQVRAHHTGSFSLRTLKANLQTLRRSPVQYLDLLRQVIRETIDNPMFLIRSLVLFPRAVWMAEEMAQEGITHVHAHYATHPALAAWIIHHLTGIPYSVTVHAHDIFVNKTMLATKLRDATFVVAISNYNRDYLAGVLGDWILEKTHVIHCGISPEAYPPPTRTRGAGGMPFKVLNIGSLQPYKGQEHLICALAELKRRGIPVHCQVIGEGKLRGRLTKLIAQNHLEGCVELLGARTQAEVADLLSEVDCYVQSSIVTPNGKMEGIPVALMEALASAVPVVATSISGIPELVQPGQTGFLVPGGDDRALADAIEKVYRDPSTAAQIACAGRDLVVESFNLHRNVSQLSCLFV